MKKNKFLKYLNDNNCVMYRQAIKEVMRYLLTIQMESVQLFHYILI